MDSIISIRLKPQLRQKLRRRALAARLPESQLVRELIERECGDRPLKERLAGLKGSLSLNASNTDAWRKTIRERNWRS